MLLSAELVEGGWHKDQTGRLIATRPPTDTTVDTDRTSRCFCAAPNGAVIDSDDVLMPMGTVA